MRIAVDIDGVLADQVSLILSDFNRKYGYSYSKEDIIKWDSCIGYSRIDLEIEKSLLNPEYVLSMPIVEYAYDAMSELSKNYTIIIATSRPRATEKETLKWLSINFNFNEFENTRDKGKKFLNADILIDDNLTNLQEFATNSGIGILLEQPWNKDYSEIIDLVNCHKVYCCGSWIEILNIIESINLCKAFNQ